jgi:hypothetical protein
VEEEDLLSQKEDLQGQGQTLVGDKEKNLEE